MTKPDMEEWLNWHINRCHFNHIHIMDNDSGFDLESLCRNYGSKVSYEKIVGRPRQYVLYDDYINNKSHADWIIPIDDDEYLWIANDLLSVNDAIKYYCKKIPDMNMLAVRWKHMFPKRFHTERTGSVLNYCIQEHVTLASTFQLVGDRGVKTFVCRSGKVHYQETTENPNAGHVPVHECAEFAYGFDGCHVTGVGYDHIPTDTQDEKIRLLHCRFKGYTEYTNKYILQDNYRISDVIPRKKNFLFNCILPTLP